MAVAAVNEQIRAPERYPSGKKKPRGQSGGRSLADGMRGRRGREKGGRNPYVEMHRVYDNWADLKRLGVNEDFGTVIGRLYMLEHISGREATAARIYATVIGRFDRFHSVINRLAKTPSYERGARARDDELERRALEGTLPEYEKRARRANKAYLKICKVLPNDGARRLLDEVCIYDIMPTGDNERRAVKNLLNAIANAYGIAPDQD